MSVAFWSGIITAGSKCTPDIPEGFVLNLQNCALETGGNGGSKPVQLFVKTTSPASDEDETLLCTLRSNKVEQCVLQLVFGYDVTATFVMKGGDDHTLHLSGYYQPGPLEEMDDNYDDMLDEDYEDEEEGYPTPGTFRVPSGYMGKSGKRVVTGDEDDDDGSDDSDGRIVLSDPYADADDAASSEEDSSDEEEDAAFVRTMQHLQGITDPRVEELPDKEQEKPASIKVDKKSAPKGRVMNKTGGGGQGKAGKAAKATTGKAKGKSFLEKGKKAGKKLNK